MKLELHKGKGVHPWHLRLRGKNGEILAQSEGYYSRFNARRAAKKNFPTIPLVEVD